MHNYIAYARRQNLKILLSDMAAARKPQRRGVPAHVRLASFSARADFDKGTVPEYPHRHEAIRTQ
jgi:hypothetical protein